MIVTEDEGQSRFDECCERAKRELVLITKDGKPDTVLLDFQAYQALKEFAESPWISDKPGA